MWAWKQLPGQPQYHKPACVLHLAQPPYHRFNRTPSFGNVPLKAADKADIRVCIHKEFNVKVLPKHFFVQDQDAFY